MSVTDEYLENNARYAASFTGPLPLPPAKGVAVVACMDARLNVYGILGLAEGEAHVIRNAGGVVTDDEIRSLAISQRLLGTTEIILIHHTDCGMLTFTDDGFSAAPSRKKPASSRPGRRKRSRTWTRTYSSPSPASRPARLSRTPRASEGSFSTWPLGNLSRSFLRPFSVNLVDHGKSRTSPEQSAGFAHDQQQERTPRDRISA